MSHGSACAAIFWGVAVLSAQTTSPVIFNTSYSNLYVGSPDVTMVIEGSGFTSGTAARLDAIYMATTFLSPSLLTAVIPGALSANPAIYELSVINPDGTTSAPGAFTVDPPTPMPISLSPNTVAAGSASLTLTISGQGFLPAASVHFMRSSADLTVLTPTSVTPTQIQVAIPASLLITPAKASVVVSNVISNGVSSFASGSNSLTFYVGTLPAGLPMISSFSPSSSSYLGPAFTITVNGSNFDPQAQIRFAGVLLFTESVSSNQITAVIPANFQMPCPATFVSVLNPAQESDPVLFPIESAPAAALLLSPASVFAQSGAFSLTVRGYGFTAGSLVEANGAAVSTAFVNSSTLTASMPAAILVAGTTLNIAVLTGGYSTGPLPLNVTGPTIQVNAILNGASGGTAIAPGSLISIYGTNLSFGGGVPAGPPVLSLLGNTVQINGRAAPLLYVSPSQINAQVPYEMVPGPATLTVDSAISAGSPQPFTVAPAAPGIYASGLNNHAVAVNLPDGALNSPALPASPGQYITVYLTGQGAVSPPVESVAEAPYAPLSYPVLETQATLAGVPAVIQFAGLAPGLAGLMQLNLQIPNVAPGEQPLQVTIGGAASNIATISIQSPMQSQN